ncbi:hypothetical protein F5890DRAFT_1560162, partial [Lentinula detonsa]
MSQQQDIQLNTTDDPSRSTTIQFGDFHESPNTQNAPLGANSTAGTPAHDRRQYWKAQYYDLRDQGDRHDANTSSGVAVAKKLDKGKGKEVTTVPLQNRITTTEAQMTTGPSVPLSQRLSPMEGDPTSPATAENAKASGSSQPLMASQAGPSLSGGSVLATLPPHTGDKWKRDSVSTSVPQRGTVSYDD